METIKTFSTLIIIIATIINLYFVYANYKTKKPVIDIKLSALPPYIDEKQKTTLTIKNVGSCETGYNPDVIVSCSWLPSISYKCNLPAERYSLDPNEEIIWRFRIDGSYGPNSSVAVKVTDKNKSKLSWELHEQI